MAWCGDDQCEEETKRRLDEYKRKGESLCNWIGALLISLNVSTPEAGVNAVATLRAQLAAALEALVIASPYVSTYPSGTKGITTARSVALAKVNAALAARDALGRG